MKRKLIRPDISKHKKAWWKRIKKNKKKYKEVCKRIGKAQRGKIGLVGEKHPFWRGGRSVSSRDGYVLVRAVNHPNSVKHHKLSNGDVVGYIMEHRLVMEKVLGRYLTKDEDVHHRNGIKDDNRIQNLMLVSHKVHFHEVECPKCKFMFAFQ